MKLVTLLALASFCLFAHADQVFSSKPTRVTMVELYTSEGCSSCPPADAWLGWVGDSGGVWEDVIPLAFHVDYWDYLGWKDRYASKQNSQRQRRYREEGHIASVYTPGIVVDGREYREFFKRSKRYDSVPPSNERPGVLQLRLDEQEAIVSFENADVHVANFAWVALSREEEIRRGENAGRTLTHHYVVLAHETRKGKGQWRFNIKNKPAEADAVVAWLSRPGDSRPVQAVGGVLSAEASGV